MREPEPAKEVGSLNDYTFERKVEFSHLGSAKSIGRIGRIGRIDLYKKRRFIIAMRCVNRYKGVAPASGTKVQFFCLGSRTSPCQFSRDPMHTVAACGILMRDFAEKTTPDPALGPHETSPTDARTTL